MKTPLAFVTLAALACCVAPVAAAPGERPSAEESPVSAEVVTIPDTGNVRIGADLEIGAGNIWAEDADAGEAGAQPLSAGLWVLARKVSPERKHHRVKAGEELTESGYRLKVLEIVKKPERAFVRVQVTALK